MCQKKLSEYKSEIDKTLSAFLNVPYSDDIYQRDFTKDDGKYNKCTIEAGDYPVNKSNPVKSAMLHSLFAGGKRVRGGLLLAFTESYGGDLTSALPVAAAIECIHTFSLIHDDLPSIDNDDFRRGKPACHKAFSEAMAVLAGDALAIFPFELISAADFSSDKKVALINEFSKLAGMGGMILGQQNDILYETIPPTGEELINMYRLKTSCIIELAAISGVILGGGDDREILNAKLYGENLGLAFQLVDDILDVEGDAKILGKPIGSDKDKGKNTAVSVFGLSKVCEMAAEYTEKAKEYCNNVPNHDFLMSLTNELLKRKN